VTAADAGEIRGRMDVTEDLVSRLRGQEWIDDPFLGPVPAARFEAASPVWPGHSRWGAIKAVAITSQAPRTVSELHFVPADSSGPVVPVGIVWDEAGGRRRARVYCNKTLLGSDQVRGPLIPPDPGLVLHPTMSRYLTALRAGDEQGLLEVLEPGLRVFGPMGELKADDVRAAFAKRMSQGGGVPIMYITGTDDGTRAAVEFISWRIRPHAGLGVYERAASGRIAEFRAYEGPVVTTLPGA
jgi:hypothetical protein